MTTKAQSSRTLGWEVRQQRLCLLYPATKAFNNRARRLFTCDATRPVHFTAPINDFNASSVGQQQRSTPLFGSGTSMSISTGQPVIGALSNKSVLTLLLTMIDGKKKTSVFVAFGRGAETNASALVALSDVFAGGHF
jgi:hypothetical protein